MRFAFLFILSISIPNKKIKENSSTMLLIDNPNEGFWSSFKINREGWNVTANSEQTTVGQGEGPVRNIIDSNPSSIWHSKYNDNEEGGHDDRAVDTDPFQITIDLGQETTFRGFSYTPRQEGGQNGKFRHYQFYIGETAEKLNDKIKNNDYLSRGDIESTSKKTTLVIYDSLITVRYIALLSVKHDGHGSCSEFNLYTDPPDFPEKTPLPTPMPVTITLVGHQDEGYWAPYRMDRDDWKVTANSEQKTSGTGEGPVSHIVDGNPSTIWHSKYDNNGAGGHDDRAVNTDPFQIAIDMRKKMNVRGFSYTPRTEAGGNGMLKDFEIYMAISKEELNVKIQNKECIAKGNIDSSTTQTSLVIFDKPVIDRYFAFLTSPVNTYGTMGEFNLYSDPPASPAPTMTPTPKPTPIVNLVTYGQEGYWASYKIDRKNWNVTANSEETTVGQGEGPAAHIIDGNPSTIWHSKYDDNGVGGHDDRKSTSDPFQFTIDLGEETTFRAFSYTPRSTGTNGRIQYYEFYVAQTMEELNDKIKKKDYVSKGNFKYNSILTSLVIYDSPKTGQFIALLSVDHDGYGTCAEFNLYSDPLATPLPTASPIPPPTVTLVDHREEGYWASYRMDRGGWNVTANSEQTTVGQGEGPIAHIVDGSTSTIWHTKYNDNGVGGHDDRGSETDPFQITIDIGQETALRGFSYTPRTELNGNGKLRDYEFYVANSMEELTTKIQEKDYLSKGDINSGTSQTSLVIYPLPSRCRYVAFLTSPVGKYATMAEFNLYSDPPASPAPTPLPRPTPNLIMVDYGKEGYWAPYRMDRFEWTATANSEQANTGDGEGPVSHIIDDASSSIWHSKYNDDGVGGHDDRPSTEDPFQITVNLGQEKVFKGFSYTPRQEGGQNGKFRHYEFYVASTEEELTEKIQNKDYLSKGDIDHTSLKTSLVIFDEAARGQFVALLSVQHDGHGTCSEFNLYSVPPASPLPTSSPAPTPRPTPMVSMFNYDNIEYWSDFKINPEGWIVTANSEHTTNADSNEGPVKNIIDGNIDTIWHTKYSGGGAGSHDDRDSTKDPYQITIDLGKETTFRAFSYTPRQKSSNGRFRHYEFYIAQTSDELKEKIKIKDYLYKGDIDSNSELTSLFVFYKAETARFIALLSVNHDSHASCAEFGLYSEPPATIPATPFPSMTEKVPDPTIIVDKDCNDNGRYERIVNDTESIMLTIKVNKFVNISHTKNGGAIYIENAGITCDGNVFESCESNDAGGAVYVKNTYDFLNLLTFENLEIKKCKANYGGGMYIYSDSSKNTVTIRDCIFRENTALINRQEGNDNELFGGSCIFLTARKGLLRRNRFYKNYGTGSVRLYNDFDDSADQNQKLLDSSLEDASVIINECNFEISTNEKYCIFYDRGNKGALLEINKCSFSGELQNDSKYIDGRVISEKSPLLIVRQCKFDIDLKKWNKIVDKNDSFMKLNTNDQTFRNNELNGKNTFMLGLMKIAVVVVAVAAGLVAAFIIFTVKKSRNNNNDKSEVDPNIIDASLF